MSDISVRLNEWLSLLDGPGWQGREARDRAVAEMRTVGADNLIPLLMPMLSSPDADVRCKACLGILYVDASQGIDVVLQLLDDRDPTVRWYLCGLMHDFGDVRAVPPLIELLDHDPDPQVRGTAAYALGGVGSPGAIPALIAVMDNDHEIDQLGYSPSFCAAGALDDILEMSETRVPVSGSVRKLTGGKPDLEYLRREALAAYDEWRKHPRT